MEALTLRQLLEAVNGTLLGEFDNLDAAVAGVSTDSRSIGPGCLFIPLEGERFDGHSFINTALEAGAAGIVVSNHGGRVQDGVPATAEVLPAIAEAVKGQMVVMVDGGIRSGVDVCKALALGADACILARPYVTALYGGGAEGVKVLTEKLRAELADTMAMCGVHTLGEISRDMIF